MMKKKTKETGITLMVLVITIVVLIILAGISIATLTGDNGILLQTNKAKEETEIASEKEVIKYSFSLTGSANVLGPGTIDSTCSFKTENELKSDEIIQLLNQENDKTIWKKDSNNINNGYSILYWQ